MVTLINMALIIPVAHDFICPWCWVGLIQAKRLMKEFGVEFEWLGYELFPEDMVWPDSPAPIPPPSNKPPTPTRFEFIQLADGVKLPTVERPKKMRSYLAHQAVEFAKTEAVAQQLVERLYQAFWEEGREINNVEVLVEQAHGIVTDISGFEASIRDRRFKDKIVPFDAPAYALGIYNVPTFMIGDERLAEQPYSVIEAALKRELGL